MSSSSGVATPAESPVTPNVDQPSVNIGRALKVRVPLPLGPTEMAAFEFVAHTQANAAVRERMIFFAIGLFVFMVWFSLRTWLRNIVIPPLNIPRAKPDPDFSIVNPRILTAPFCYRLLAVTHWY